MLQGLCFLLRAWHRLASASMVRREAWSPITDRLFSIAPTQLAPSGPKLCRCLRAVLSSYKYNKVCPWTALVQHTRELLHRPWCSRSDQHYSVHSSAPSAHMLLRQCCQPCLATLERRHTRRCGPGSPSSPCCSACLSPSASHSSQRIGARLGCIYLLRFSGAL